MNKFEDVVEVLALEGNIQYAAVLLNKLRTRPFFESKPGEVIWRVELWRFERPEETWVKLQDELFVTLYRERLQRKDFDRKCVAFVPSLGGLQPTADAPQIDVGQLPALPSTPGIRILGQGEKESQP